MVDQTAILIAAISGRALAASARRGGYLPLVTDFFGDQDTLHAAHGHVRLAGNLARGIEEQALLDALAELSERHRPLGVVYGSGFEDRAQILRRIAQRWRLFGNDAETVTRIKSPEFLAKMCGTLEIPIPELSLIKPTSPAGWLAKRKGGAGGAHIGAERYADPSRREIYYQRKVPGT